MRTLPLYTEGLYIAAEREEALDLDQGCARCPLNREHLRHPCIGADGGKYEPDEPTLMVVGDFPMLEDDGCGRIMTTSAGVWVRGEVERRWSGSVVYDVGVRCAPSGVAPKPDWVNACRPYLASTLLEVRPSRIITMGAYAGRAVLGRQVPPLSVRRGYAYTSYGAPVFMLMSGSEATQNRFKREWFIDDLEWAISARPKPPPTDAVCRVIEDGHDAKSAVEDLRSGDWVTYDSEWSGLMFDGSDGYYRLLCLAMTKRGNPNPYVWSEEALNDPVRWAPLANLLSDPNVLKGGHNLKADVMAVMAKKWMPVNVRGVAYDTLLIRKGLASDIDGSLDFAAELVGMGGHKEENDAYVREAVQQIKYAREQSGQGVQFVRGVYSAAVCAAVAADYAIDPKAYAYAEVPPDVLHRYCARDVVSTDLVADLIWPTVESDAEISSVNEVFVRPAIPAFAQVEAWGMALDKTANRRVAHHLSREVRRLEEKIAGYGSLNPNSDKDKARFLYEELKLPVMKRTKNENPSVDADALKQIQDKHPVVSLLMDHSELTTINNTFAAGMSRFVRGDGRVHTDFRLTGTRTGRLSSGSPNLQNIPSRNPVLSKMVKDCFIAPPGRMIIQCDYSQLEYRVAAMLSEDPVFSQVFIDGHDAHRRTAELIAPYTHGMTVEQAEAMTDKEIKGMRSDAKTVNFGCIAEGSEVLTHVGLVLIEDVQAWHLVWDGVEWVQHDGVVYQGFKEVLTYQGLTATRDHEVFLEGGGTMSFQEAVGGSRRLAVGAVGDVRHRYVDPYWGGGEAISEPLVRRGDLFRGSIDESSEPKKAHVYDILNAGPRHRFTVSGIVVHNCLYGKTVRTLARDLGCSVEQAQVLYDVIMGKFSRLKEWIDARLADAMRTGMCWTYLVGPEGPVRFQRRQLYNIAGPDDLAASRARNGAINSPVQGTAAGYMNRTVCAVVDWILADHVPAKVTNTVHDSIIVEVDVHVADEVALTTRDIMEGFPSGNVPLRADVEVGWSWGSMVAVKRVGDQWEFKGKGGETEFSSTLVGVLEAVMG